MYVTYTYRAGATAQNILDDLTALIIGATSLASLSACVLSDSRLVITEPAGWELYDANAGVLSKVFRAPYDDDAASYKYLRIAIDSSIYVRLYSYESWNPVAHTGTNEVSGFNNTSYSQKINLTLGGRLDIRATARTFMIFSLQGGIFGNELGGSSFQALCERSRGNEWDTIAAGYPKWVCFSGLSGSSLYCNIYSARTISAAGADVTGASALYYVLHSSFIAVVRTTSNAIHSVKAFAPNAQKQYAVLMFSVHVSDSLRGDLGGEFGDLCGVYFTEAPLYKYDKIVSDAGQEYICWTDQTNRWMIKVA